MSRPRIRSLKPEMFADERIKKLSRDARLLLIGLITMADDEGRLRADEFAILGHVFPADRDAQRKLAGWMSEVLESRIVLAYTADSLPYLAFRHWRRHQRISKPAPSKLPAPPDPVVVADNSFSATSSGNGAEESRNGSGTVAELSRRRSG